MTSPKYELVKSKSWRYRLAVYFHPVTKATFTHAVGTSSHHPQSKYRSWLHFWEIQTNQPALRCAFQACGGTPTVGAHVQYSGTHPRYASWYIVPACAGCNAKRGLSAPLRNPTTLVMVMKSRFARPNQLLTGKQRMTTAASPRAAAAVTPRGGGTRTNAETECDHTRVWPLPRKPFGIHGWSR